MKVIDKLHQRVSKVQAINTQLNADIVGAFQQFFKEKNIDKVVFEEKPIFYSDNGEILYILNVSRDCFGSIKIRNMCYDMPPSCCDTDINEINLKHRQKIDILERMYKEID